jgi:ABC-type transporter Mla subunit MlaD
MQLNRPALRVVGPDGDIASTKDDLDPQVAGDLRDIARLTNVTSSGIARNGFFLDRIADEAAARAEGMDGSVAMLGEMVDTMHQVLTSARRSSEIAERTGETSATAGTIARDALAELDRAADSIVRLTGMVAQLRTRVEGIGGVIGAIEDISSHSHMLSINATIEAAHAGEWGRTFAVIAVEIAKFAAATKTATSEIDGILHDVRAQVEALSGASQETLQATSHVQKSSRAIERALKAVRTETDLNHQHAATMASAAAQHSAALHGVVEAIRESAAGAASSLRMAAQARDLRIGDLNSGVYAILGKYRVGTFVERALAVAEAAAGEIEAVFDEALSRGAFSLDDLLDPVYRELHGAEVRARPALRRATRWRVVRSAEIRHDVRRHDRCAAVRDHRRAHRRQPAAHRALPARQQRVPHRALPADARRDHRRSGRRPRAESHQADVRRSHQPALRARRARRRRGARPAHRAAHPRAGAFQSLAPAGAATVSGAVVRARHGRRLQ